MELTKLVFVGSVMLNSESEINSVFGSEALTLENNEFEQCVSLKKRILLTLIDQHLIIHSGECVSEGE